MDQNLRNRNRAMLVLLLGLCVLFYCVAFVRTGG